MAVYKDNATGTWRVICRFTNWMGERKQTQKRGFATKREAQAWEHEAMLKQGAKHGLLNDALKRASVQSLREYLLYGVDGEEYTTKSYEVRIKKAFEEWRGIVNKYDDGGEDFDFYRVISRVLAEHEHVYMEMGIQAGFRLAKEMEGNQGDDKQNLKYKEMYSSLFQDVTKVIEELQKAQNEAWEIYIFK